MIGRWLAVACALVGSLILGAGCWWRMDAVGFTVLGWVGVVALVAGGLNVARVLEGRKSWI